jgi:hypothetical protein
MTNIQRAFIIGVVLAACASLAPAVIMLTAAHQPVFDPRSVIGQPTWSASLTLRQHGYQSIGGYDKSVPGFRTFDDIGRPVEVITSARCGSDLITVAEIYTGKISSTITLPADTVLFSVHFADGAVYSLDKDSTGCREEALTVSRTTIENLVGS